MTSANGPYFLLRLLSPSTSAMLLQRVVYIEDCYGVKTILGLSDVSCGILLKACLIALQYS